MKYLNLDVHYRLPDDFEGDLNDAIEHMLKYRRSEKNHQHDFKYDPLKNGYDNWWEMVNSTDRVLFGSVFLGRLDGKEWTDLTDLTSSTSCEATQQPEFTVVHANYEDRKSVYVSDKDGRAFGELYIRHDSPEDAVVCNVFVSELHRRKGIGTALLQKRIEIAKELGAQRVHLWLDKNSPVWVRENFERHGFYFREDGKENVNWEIDGWMTKDI